MLYSWNVYINVIIRMINQCAVAIVENKGFTYDVLYSRSLLRKFPFTHSKIASVICLIIKTYTFFFGDQSCKLQFPYLL